jgi:hypothetical protein
VRLRRWRRLLWLRPPVAQALLLLRLARWLPSSLRGPLSSTCRCSAACYATC